MTDRAPASMTMRGNPGLAAHSRKSALSDGVFRLSATVLALVKLAIVSDLVPLPAFAPHDDRLYVMRAFFLLNGSGFGPYDSWALAKFPGLSIWLAALRWLGLPYLPTMNILMPSGLLFGRWRRLCAMHSRSVSTAESNG
ncbi:MAG: hypothetical protein WA373_14845 [Burkholderiales bacterium]